MNMEYEEWTAALAPKVQGTWNLHNVLGDTQLDFFVLFSSFVGYLRLEWPDDLRSSKYVSGQFCEVPTISRIDCKCA